MNRDEAINLSRMEIIGTFKVLSIEGMSKEEEESSLIKLADPSTSLTVPDEAEDGQEVYYVTFGFDSVQGDGDFKVTCRVVDPMGDEQELPVRVVDFLAIG